jgi:hypothetical protein
MPEGVGSVEIKKSVIEFPQLNQHVTAFFSGVGRGDMVEDF